MSQTPTSISQEDYLERIDVLIDTKGYARVSDIAKALKLGRPSVSSMVQQLSRLGYVNYEKYRGITLTDTGRRVAADIRERHALLSELFQQIGLDPKAQIRDIEGMEHHLSSATLAAFHRLVQHLKHSPIR